MNVWGMTDIGLVRKDNQDAYATDTLESGQTVCVVCDGMGGTAGGQLASHIAVTTFMEELRQILKPEMTPQQLREASSYAAALANKAIRAAAEQSEDCRNMGTTLVSAVSYDQGAVVCNVGDSRAYHITQDGIVRVTKDHSVVENMVDRGDITAEEARRPPQQESHHPGSGSGCHRGVRRLSLPHAVRGLPAAVHRRPGGHRHGPGDAL